MIVTLADTGVEPSVEITDVGDTVQVELAGAPLHTNATAWLNPPTGLTVSVEVPVIPLVTVSADGEAASPKPSSFPVPLSATNNGFGKDVTVIAKLAVSVTACEAVRVTLIVHDAIGAILVPQVVVLAKSESAAAGEPLEIATPPKPMVEALLFVRVTV